MNWMKLEYTVKVKFRRRVLQFLCGVRGHTWILYWEPKGVKQRCKSCNRFRALPEEKEE